MANAIAYVNGNAVNGSNYNDNVMATIKLPENAKLEGKGWSIATDSTVKGDAKATRVTIDLNGSTYTFNEVVTSLNSSKNKALKIGEARNYEINSHSSVIIKNGTLSTDSSAITGGLERFARVYTDFTLDNVTIDADNLANQEGGAEYAAICVSQGIVSLTGDTTIKTKAAEGNKIYYGVSGKLGHISSGSGVAEFVGDFKIVVDTEKTVGQIGLEAWEDGTDYTRACW